MLFVAAVCLSLPYYIHIPGKADDRILVATKELQDGVFDKTVLFIKEHDSTGAFGVILNKPAENPDELGFGGPVEPENLIMIHSSDVLNPASMLVEGKDLAVSYDQDFIKSVMTSDKKPREYVIYKGHAGWGYRQLDREMRRGAWKVIDFDRDMIFKTPSETMWDEATKRPEYTPPKEGASAQ